MFFKLKHIIHIRRSISVLLICLFAFSITPVILLHSIFAHHQDKLRDNAYPGLQLSVAGFNCNTGNFVAEPHFFNPDIGPDIKLPKGYNSLTLLRNCYLFSCAKLPQSLRGPPQLA